MILGSSGLNGESQRTNSKPTFVTFRLTAVTFGKSDAKHVQGGSDPSRQAVKLKPSPGAVSTRSLRHQSSQGKSESSVTSSPVLRSRDVINGSTRSSSVTSSRQFYQQGRAGFKGVYIPTSMPSAAIHANFV